MYWQSPPWFHGKPKVLNTLTGAAKRNKGGNDMMLFDMVFESNILSVEKREAEHDRRKL